MASTLPKVDKSAQFEAAFDALGQAVGLFDADLHLFAWNELFSTMFRYPRELCREGSTLADLIRFEAQQGYLKTPDLDAAVKVELDLAMRPGTSVPERQTPGGARISVNHLALPGGGVLRVCSEVAPPNKREGDDTGTASSSPEPIHETIEALEAMGDAFVYYDANDRLVRCNPKYKEVYSAVSEKIVPGTRFEDLVRSAVECGQVVLEEQSPEEYVQWRTSMHQVPSAQFEIHLKDGRWLRVTERQTSTGGVVSVHTDVTELRERENALRSISDQLSRQNVLFDAALNNMIQGLCLFDDNQRLIVVNRRYLEMYKFSPQVVKPGITLREIMEYSVALGNYAPEEGDRALSERPSQAEKRELDVLLQKLSDGRVIAVMHSPLPNGGSVATYEDVSQRETTELTLREYTSRLENSNSELEAFAFVASHDLQEPLRKIESFGSRLKAKHGEALGEEGNMYIDRMQNAAGRMRRLIIDLLTYSRITTQAQPFEPAELEKIIHEVISDLQIAIEESGATIDVGPMPIVEADPTQMRQVFQNFFSNALKFRKADVAPKITIEGRVFDEKSVTGNLVELLEIKVTDNGIGFDNKYADRIFAIFQRLHGKSEYEGTGIGLATCRKIVDRHRGTIQASGTLGEGATFVITLPTKQSSSEQSE